MTAFEKYVDEKVSEIITKYEKLDGSVFVSENGFSVEFFVTIDGERKQNYEMVDNEEVSEEAMEKLTEDIAGFFRKTPEYVPGKVNEVSFVITK